MARLLPVLLAVVAIGVVTYVDGRLTERWGDNRHGSYCATLLDEVPKEIGDWVGEDGEVEELVQEVAGARGYVSRVYTNQANGDRVGVWFICGHARDTARHTPDVCYGGSGFKKDEPIAGHRLVLDQGEEVTFRTCMFVKQGPVGQRRERVFWTWFKPTLDSGEPVVWRAPEGHRFAFGAAPALYKLYFTAYDDEAEATDKSICLDFAREFLPTVKPLLAKANASIPDGFVPPRDDDV